MQFTLTNGVPSTGRVLIFVRGIPLEGCSSPVLGSGPFTTARTLHGFLATTLSFDNERQPSTTKGAGKYSLHLERNHRSPHSRKGNIFHHASEGCIWFCQFPSDNDQGEFALQFRGAELRSRVPRILLLTKAITLSSGCTAPMSVRSLSGE